MTAPPRLEPERGHCDLCGDPVANPYDIGHFRGRRQLLCGPCLGRLARGIAAVHRATARKAA